MLNSVPSTLASLASAGESGGPCADDEHVELHAIAGAVRALLENQFAEW